MSIPRRRWLEIEGKLVSFPETMYSEVMDCNQVQLAEHLTSPNETIRRLAQIRANRIKGITV